MRLTQLHMSNPLITSVRNYVDLILNKHNIIINWLSLFFIFILSLRAITQMDYAWDSLAYHLPFAARLGGIYDLSEFITYSGIENLYLGGPKLAEFFQGILWRVTGLVSATNLVGLISLLLFMLVASKRFKIEFWTISLFIFSIPLVLIHSVTSYNDLPTNSFLAMGIINLLAAYDKDKFDYKNYLFTLLPLAVAANMKYQGLIVSIAIFMLATLIFTIKNWKGFKLQNSPKRILSFVLIAFISLVLLGANFLSNFVRFGNPFYPVATKIGPLDFDGPFKVYGVADTEEEPDMEYKKSSYKKYVMSLSELKIWTQNSGRIWSIDMSTVGLTKGDAVFKTGGFFVLNLLLWGSLLIYALFSVDDKKSIFYIILIFGNFLFVGFLPYSHFLRYWLYLPLCLAITALLTIKRCSNKLQPIYKFLLILQFAILIFVLYQTSDQVLPHNLSSSTYNKVVNSFRGNYSIDADLNEPVCLVSTDTRHGFLYKHANPEVTLQAVTNADSCIYPKVVEP